MQAATALGANGFSVSTGFPWGVSIGLSWPIPPISPENSAIAGSTQDPIKASTERARKRRARWGKRQVSIPSDLGQ